MAEPEHDWLERYRKGDVEALGLLVEHYRRPLYAFILRMTEGRGDAEEIFQEVWFRAIRKLDRYRDRRLLSWLFRIAHNLIIDRARKRKPELHMQEEDENGNTLEQRLAAPGLDPARLSEGALLGERIHEAVARLPLKQREVFLMRTEGELPFKDIARIQGTSINTALARMQYAVRKMQEMLKEEYLALGGTSP